MISAGNKSGVNCILLNSHPKASAKVLDINVFANPGKSSNKILPLARIPAMTISIVCSFPNTTLETSSAICFADLLVFLTKSRD